ncbi:MAG: gamma-glutamyltransferase [Hellea sp.]|nr:gamma-glutamyltransferase [Hellea sp.]
MRTIGTIILALAVGSHAFAKDPIKAPPQAVKFDSRISPQVSENGMVAAQDVIAAEVGRDILAKGGNAVDAAVAVGFALAVTHPQAGNLGGGGFMMISLDGQDVIALDFREMAPAAASRDMFIGADGEVDNDVSWYSRKSSGVPGTVMGLLDALETYGTMNRKQVIGPAQTLAKDGFPVSYSLSASLENHRSELSIDPSSVEYFFKADAQGYRAGELLVQPDLAGTLKRIIRKGRDGFYSGETADLIVAEMQSGTGLITHDDLANYKSVTRKAVTGTYRGYDISAMPPPSSGGVHIVQMLNILEGYDLKSDGHNSAAYIHKLIEVMRRAYADRSKHLGDPDFYDVPVRELTSAAYAKQLRATIDPKKATRSSDIAPAVVFPDESPATTHYAVMDKDGNAVAVTYTLNFSYGSGYSVDGAGFLLNNEMDDFSSKPGSPNGYGLIGGEANGIEPRKRPLSSMSPTIVRENGKNILATGSVGGSTIISQTLQIILNLVEFDMNVKAAVQAPRVHHQWLPDLVYVEPGISPDTIIILKSMGHKFLESESENGSSLGGNVPSGVVGRANSVAWDGHYFYGANDERDPKSSASGY